jgi:hypothetical protein
MSLPALALKLYIVNKNKELNGLKVEEATAGALTHIPPKHRAQNWICTFGLEPMLLP